VPHVTSNRPARLTVLVLAAAIFVAVPSAARERYAIVFESGERVETDKLPRWPLPDRPFEVGGRQLFSAENPAVLVRDTKATSKLDSAALVMTNGDVLNGLPQRLEPTAGRNGEPALLQVQLEAGLTPVDGSTISVRADRVRRILARGRSLWPQPPAGTVVLADGRQLQARSIRWREYGLALLTESGILEANFPDIVDVVFPAADVLQGVLEDNLRAGAADRTIVRFSLSGGGVLTTSDATRVEERSRARGRQRIDVLYFVQPAWTRQSIAIREEDISWCGYRSENEALLPLMPDETLANRRLVGPLRSWSRSGSDVEVVPTAGGREADLAVAAQAYSEIAFDLPPVAKSLSLAVGIAQHVRPGGCVICKIFADSAAGKLLWESGFLTGADEAKETGDIDVAGLKRVVLVTEFAHEGRPAGSDPLDIRDDVRWLRPVIELDLAKLTHPAALAAMLPGVEAWRMDDAEWSRASIASQWSEVRELWEPVLTIPQGTVLKLTRQIDVTRSGDILELLVACPASVDDQAFELSVDGTPLEATLSREPKELRKPLENMLPRLRRRDRERERERRFDDTIAYWWDLQAWRGKQVTLTLTLRGDRRAGRIAWRGLSQRSAIGNLPADGQLPRVDVPLTSVEPLDVSEPRDRVGPAKDALPGRRGEPIRYLGQVATGGYGMVRNSHASFEIKPQFGRFVAVVGAVGGSSGPFEVLVDDQVVWHRDAADHLAPAELLEIDLPAGAKRLTLVNGNEGSYGGHAGWTEAGFVLRPAE